jgi:hypothetical protein
MTTTLVADGALHIVFTRREKLAGLLRDQHVPVTSVRSVEVVADALAATTGLRAPGLGIPGHRKLGTWRRASTRTLVDVRRGQPAVRITVDDQPYDAMLLGVDDPQALADALTAARPR